MKIHCWETEEGLKITVELLQKGVEDEYQVEDWEITVEPSPGYRVDDIDKNLVYNQSGFVLKTSRREE